MTRGRWVALAVVVAVIAVLASYGPALWRALVYTLERKEPISPHARYYIEGTDDEFEALDFEYVSVMRKRFDWLPGPDRYVRCAWCVASDHAKCSGSKRLVILADMRDPSLIDWSRCNCPHPSHAQESQ